jgi:hypothetical protein
MTDFWFDVIWTIVVTTATILADWIAYRLITATRAVAAIERAVDQTATDQDKVLEITEHVHKLRAKQSSALTWGADLAAVAISLDLTALGIWIGDPGLFPFFSRWNRPNVSREIQIWLVLLFVHLVLLMVSILFKHLHGEKIESIQPSKLVGILHREWFGQSGWMITCNSLGFVVLLSSLLVLTNAIY